MDLLFLAIGLFAVIISFWKTNGAILEISGLAFIVVGIILNVATFFFSSEKIDRYTVTQLEGIVFEKPTKIKETYTEYPFSFRQDKVVYDVEE